MVRTLQKRLAARARTKSRTAIIDSVAYVPKDGLEQKVVWPHSNPAQGARIRWGEYAPNGGLRAVATPVRKRPVRRLARQLKKKSRSSA